MEHRHHHGIPRPSRRALLAGATAAGALAWIPAFRARAATPPPNFPSSIAVYQQACQNWAGMIAIDDVWTCTPASAADVVALANWAHANGYRLRAKGMSHGWSPILLPVGSTGAGYVLVDTTQHLTSVAVTAGSPLRSPRRPGRQWTAMALVDTGLVFTGTWDVWGQWQNVLRHALPSTVRIVQAGFAVITSRASIQQVVSDFYAQYTSRLSYYAGLGQYPMNGPVEIRITGLDHPADVAVTGAQSPILSSVRPRPDHPEWDVAVWLDMGTLPVTPGFSQFYADMESWIWRHYTGSYATVRPEWSKAWACTPSAPWTGALLLSSTIPAAVSAGQASGAGWAAAVSILSGYDPGAVFSNPFLDTLLR